VTRSLQLTVNGRVVEVRADPDTPLLDVLRDDLGLAGTRFGCGMGLCGACFVHLDGAVVPSCDTPAWSAEGRSVVTIEGLRSRDAGLHPVQQAILDRQAAQCGFCISGIVMSAAALLERHPDPDRAQVAEALDRNLCRCGSHRRILEAVLQAGADARGGR
jgi:nicotinate dehydrogenase subunit A